MPGPKKDAESPDLAENDDMEQDQDGKINDMQ